MDFVRYVMSGGVRQLKKDGFKVVGRMLARKGNKKCRACQRVIRIHFPALILENTAPVVGTYRIPLCEACGRDFEKEDIQ